MITDNPKADVSIGDNPTLAVPTGGIGASPLRPRPGRRFAAGDVILGRYTVVRELGEGGMGVVYQCLDTVGGVEVAVKGLPPEVSRNEEEMEDIRANYRLVADLHHSNIAGARTLELDQSTGDYYLVMDLAKGVTLKSWMRRNPAASRGTKIALLRQIAAALDYAHAEKVIHRDVKPENVMVDDEGRVKVLDFGLAAQIRSSQSRTSNAVTSKGGTPGYKSPEQWLGSPQKAPTDVYSFGVMAYWLLAGQLPFDGDDPVVLGHAVISAPVEPVEGLPAYMNAALAKVLAKKPEERFPSCGEFVDALGGAQLVAPATVGSRVPRDRSPKGGAWKVFAVLALLAALAGGGYYGWTKYDEGVRAREAEQAAERARLAKASEERIARLKAEKEKVEAEKRKIEAERARREAEQAEERARNERLKAETAKPKPADVAKPTLAEQEARRKEVARLAELRVEISIKCDDAKEKMDKLAAYRGEQDGFKSHIDNADEKWKSVEAAERSPTTIATAEASLKAVADAENAIAKELHWLSTNKTARDGAQAIEKEIADRIDPELVRFKASDYARAMFPDGDRLRKEGNAALANGDFTTAKEKLDAAKAKLSAAAAEARKFCIDTHLGTAKKWYTASKWQQCVDECDKVLGWDAANAEAKELKETAEGHLVPSATVVATVNGREVSGAKLNDGAKIHTTPIKWTLATGKKYGPYEVSYESGGRRYYGTFQAVTVDWRGPRPFTVTLKEYTGPKHGDTKTITLPGGATMEMIYVVPSTFTMGSPSTEDGRFDKETQHEVTLTKGFWLGKYEVTQEQWESVMGENPSRFKGGRNPVENVSWDDCQSFIRKINTQQNCGARLPTEAEWEYACRAGSTGPFSGNGNLDDMGWYNANSGNETHPVGGKSANAWGFYDMHGNVREWCGDWYGDYDGDTTDPTGPASGVDRVLRGGCWDDGARFCRSADRYRNCPDDRYFVYNGLRLCCSAGLRE